MKFNCLVHTIIVMVLGDFNIALDISLNNITGQPHAAREIMAFKQIISTLDVYDS